MSVPGKTISRMSLNLREGNSPGVPDKITVTYEISDSNNLSNTERKRVPFAYTPTEISTLTVQALWDASLLEIEAHEKNSLVQIYTTSLPAGTNNVIYNPVNLADINSVGNLTWSIDPNHDSLPTGMSFSSSGILSGTPTSIGTFNIEFVLTSDADASLVDRKVLQLVINP